MFQNMKLNTKLMVLFLLVGVIPFGIIGFLSYRTASRALSAQSFHQLEAISGIKHAQIASYFGERRGDAEVLNTNQSVIDALKAFSEAYTTEGKSVGGPLWAAAENKFGPWLVKYQKGYGYYDLFIVNSQGEVVYTAAKESDLGANLRTGALKDSPLGRCFSKSLDGLGMQDFEPYAPSGGVPASFIGSPIVEGGRTIGVVMLQIPLDAINKIMQTREGMGKTGESYLVGSDKLMRSDSFLDPTNHSVEASFKNPAKGSVDTEGSREALAGKTDIKIIIDYNGNPVLSSYRPLEINGVKWAILSEIDKSEALASVRSLTVMIITIAVISITLIVILAFVIARSITGPINRIIEGLTEGAEQVGSASGQVSSASQQLAEGAAEQASSLEEISSSLEEMSSMTRQNASNADQANNLAKEARTASERGNAETNRMLTAIQKISESSNQTQKIIKTIDEIAFQTNLLALNAAVEAARAGEAGKGFAVVAEEVRNLAQRAGEAARNTASLIEESVNNTAAGTKIADEMAKSLSEITTSSVKVSDLVAEIAAASKEQAQGIDQVNTAIGQMDRVTQTNASNAEESASASEELNSQAGELNTMVEELVTVIGGTDSQDVRAAVKNVKKVTGNGGARKAAGHQFEALEHLKAARTQGAGRAIPAGGKTQFSHGKSLARKPAPEAVIPLDDEKGGFEEF